MEMLAAPVQKLKSLIYNHFLKIKAWENQDNSPVASTIALKMQRNVSSVS
jgi:hypothetical protein